MILSEAETRELTGRIIGLSQADSCLVSIGGHERRHIRYAQNMATTSGAPSGISIGIESHFGKRSGSASGNALDDVSLRALVAASEATARRAPENPEFLPPPGPQKYPAGSAFFPATQEASPAQLAATVQPVLRQAEAQSLQASGFLQTGVRFSSLASGTGLFVHDRATEALHTVTARTADGTGSGWAGIALEDFSRLAAAAMGAVAMDKAIWSRQPSRLPPGKYTVILEPAAVADLVGMMMGEFDARSADEGRSFATKKGGGSRLGEKIFGSNITVFSDPNDPLAPGAIYSDEGLPAARTPWIEAGVLKNLPCGRYWAQHTGAPRFRRRPA